MPSSQRHFEGQDFFYRCHEIKKGHLSQQFYSSTESLYNSIDYSLKLGFDSLLSRLIEEIFLGKMFRVLHRAIYLYLLWNKNPL